MNTPLILYNGREMTPDWPAKIRAAQRRRTFRAAGVSYPRIPYGHEQCWDAAVWPPPTPCRDCGVLLGQLHVPGCCLEACPACPDTQRISCEVHECA